MMLTNIRYIYLFVAFVQDLDLSPGGSTMSSMLDEDEASDASTEYKCLQYSEHAPPPSPIRRGGISSGSMDTEGRQAAVRKPSIPKDRRSRESLTRVFNTNLFFR